MEELEIIHHHQIDGMSLFFDTVDYRTPHFHPEWELIWITEGRLSIQLAADHCVGEKDDLFLFCPGMMHEFQKVGKSATFLCLQLSSLLFERAYPGFARLLTEDFRVNPYFGEDCTELRSDLVDLMSLYLERQPFFELKCIGSCALLFSRLFDVIPYHIMSTEEIANYDKRNARLSRFIRFVDENYMHKISLSEFAEELPV